MRSYLLSSLVSLIALLALASSASAAEPWWHLGSGSRPSVLAPGSEGELVVTAENVGDAHGPVQVECDKVAPGAGKYKDAACDEAAEPGRGEYEKTVVLSEPVRIVDTLPPGLEAVVGGVAGSQPKPDGSETESVALSCARESLSLLSCETSVPVVPFDQIEVRIEVRVLPGARVCEQGESTCEQNEVSVSGGGAPPVSVSRPVTVSDRPTPFGVEDYELSIEPEGGGSMGADLQAGSHPFQVTGTIALDQGPDTAPPGAGAPRVAPVGQARNIVARLPAGLIADPKPVERCLEWEFLSSDGSGESSECEARDAVGVASVTAVDPGGGGTFTVAAPIFNVEPEAGEPARFGFFVPFANVPVFLNTSVRSGPGEDWGVDLSTSDIAPGSGLISARVTFWGVPDSSAHMNARGWGCLAQTRGRPETAFELCTLIAGEAHPGGFVRLPTSCTGPLRSSVQAGSWEAGESLSVEPGEALPALSRCGEVPFSPSIETVPTTSAAASPSGLAFALNFDSEGLLSPTETAQSDLKTTVVSLPEGITIDPSAGVGLGACTRAEYEAAALGSSSTAGCPEDSKLGTVEIDTPLLFTTVYGSLYLAQPYENPFAEPGHPGGSLIALYVVARSRAERGILVKLAGRVTPDPVTGRLTVTFENDPQLPFERFVFHFREGQQAPLITPATCGTYTTQALLTPFSEPAGALNDTATFQITSGSEGLPCPSGPLPPFEPKIASQTLNSDAGVFSPLSVELTRTDAMSEVASYSTVLPVGLTANLSGVPFCPEADIQRAREKTGVQEEGEPSCPAASTIGHTLVGTGVGSVLDYVPGVLYLSGPFDGDPFSVVSVTSAVVGPFDLGTIVIRFGLKIDPYTAQVSVDPTGSEPIPTIIDGIVTHVRDIRASIDRPGFTLNPTSCQTLGVSSTMMSNYGQSATVSAPFQSANCKELAFKPKFSVSTAAKTSKADGASLTAKLTVPIALGSQSNIKQVKVDLPKQLPSRLTTLQQACTDKQFEANPAGCPAASKIGYAKATTPILPVPLEGPAIFVSHGGEAFPSLILVLQGYGVTVDLVGSTYISPQGITSTTFKAVPDEPVGSFELTLPEGPYSALAADGNLCDTAHSAAKAKTTIERVALRRHGHIVRRHGRVVYRERKVKRKAPGLAMPTEFLAQNGAVVKQGTKIAVIGCPPTRSKVVKASKKKKKKKGKGKK